MSELRSKLIKTKNIKNTMQTYASKNLVPLAECDFNIKSAKTYIKTAACPDFVLFNDNINEEYADKEKLLNEYVELQQLYIIEVKTKRTQKIKLEYSINFEKFSTHPKLIIHPNSIIPYKTEKAQEIFTLLIKEINKIKSLNGILINIFDRKMVDTLKKFVQYIYAGKFTKKIIIPLFEGLEPELLQESRLIMHFEEKGSIKELIEVEKEELLVEFLKPFYGKKGFNALGQIVENGFGINIHDLNAQICI